MNLTIGEYCLFNRHSRINLLERKGVFVSRIRVDETHEIKLFDFYVEVLWNIRETKVLSIEPIKGQQWLVFYSLPSIDENEIMLTS